MKSKTTLAGALAALGTFLFGVPYMLNTVSPDFPKTFSVFCMGLGIFCTGGGIFLGHLWSADSKDLDKLTEKVETNRSQIAETKEAVRTGDTSVLNETKTQVVG